MPARGQWIPFPACGPARVIRPATPPHRSDARSAPDGMFVNVIDVVVAPVSAAWSVPDATLTLEHALVGAQVMFDTVLPAGTTSVTR